MYSKPGEIWRFGTFSRDLCTLVTNSFEVTSGRDNAWSLLSCTPQWLVWVQALAKSASALNTLWIQTKPHCQDASRIIPGCMRHISTISRVCQANVTFNTDPPSFLRCTFSFASSPETILHSTQTHMYSAAHPVSNTKGIIHLFQLPASQA